MKKKKYKKNPYAQGGSIYDFLFDEEDEEQGAPTAPSTDELATERAMLDKKKQELQYQQSQFQDQMTRQSAIDIALSDYAPRSTHSAQGNSSLITDKSRYAFEFFKSKGIPAHAAAGITGNLMQESGNFRDDVVAGTRTGDFGTAFGIAQWRNERKAGLEKFAKSKGMNPYTLDAQLEYVFHEGTQRGDIQALANTKDSEEAAYTFAKRYEKPKIIDPYRIKYAKSLHP